MEKLSKSEWKALLARAKRGEPDAEWEVGYYYEYGVQDESGKWIAKYDPVKALNWYALSANQGYVNAQESMSNILSSGKTIEHDYAAAIKWAQLAIAQGSATAAHNLATIYRDLGKPAKAFRHYQQAVEMGSTDSLLEVGFCHLFGFCTRQDLDSAYDCFNQIIDANPVESSQRTQENACFWIAILHLLKNGSAKKSLSYARKLLETANEDDDHEQANDILNLIGKSSLRPPFRN